MEKTEIEQTATPELQTNKPHKKKPLFKKLLPIFIIFGIILILCSAAAVYAMVYGISINIAGRNIDIQYDDRIRISATDENIGCCFPACQETIHDECKPGYEWTQGGCALVSGCDEICCLPYCKDMKRIDCSGEHNNDYAGTPVDKKCADVKECREGCCIHDCEVSYDINKAACKKMEGEWKKDCNKGCCKQDDQYLYVPEEICKEECMTGSEWIGGICPGYMVTLHQSGSSEADLSGLFGSSGTGLNELAEMSGGDLTVEYDITYDLYNCENDVNSRWQGTMTRTLTQMGNTTTTEDKIDIYLDSGEFTTETEIFAGSLSYSIVVDDDMMYITTDIAIIPPIEMEGKIVRQLHEKCI